MKRRIYRWSVAILCGWVLSVGATEPVELHDTALLARYTQLTDSLRCPKCENQSISSSNAPVAMDMRRYVSEWLLKGYSDERIQNEMVARFGEYVLYQPRFSQRTLLLWTGPAVLGVLAISGVVMTVRSRRHPVQLAPLDPDEQALLQRVLARHQNDGYKEHDS